MGDDRPARYVEQGAGEDGEDLVVYRASSLGTCDRVLVAYANGRVGAPTPDWMQKIFDEGHLFEDVIRQRYRDETGRETYDDQREVTLDLGTIRGAHVIVRGHIDDLAPRDTGLLLVDYKKVRDSGWGDFQRQGLEWQRNYPWQMSAYWHGLAQEGVELTGWELVGGHLEGDAETEGEGGWTEDTREITELCIHHGDDAPLGLLAIRKRVARVEKMVAEGLDAPETPCNKSVYPCPFYKLHDPEPDEDEFTWPEGDDEVQVILDGFDRVSAEIRELKRQVKTLEAQKKDYTDAVYALIEHYGDDADRAKKLVGRGYTVSRVRGTRTGYTVEDKEQDYLKITKNKEGK